MNATYVYCVVGNPSTPRVPRGRRRMPGGGTVRLLDLGDHLWAAVSDVPLDHYGEAALAARMQDLDWVSHAAVAHEAVVASFLPSASVVPMKMFTLFSSDERAVRDLGRARESIRARAARVARHEEWGLRVVLGRTASSAPAGARMPSSGASYLQRKKAQRDSVLERAGRARAIVADLFDTLAQHASDARRRSASELPAQGGPLLLDAALLIPRTRSRRFQAAVARAARVLQPQGYDVMITGPWPPYSFVQD